MAFGAYKTSMWRSGSGPFGTNFCVTDNLHLSLEKNDRHGVNNIINIVYLSLRNLSKDFKIILKATLKSSRVLHLLILSQTHTHKLMYTFILKYYAHRGYAVAQVFEALCYKPEGRGFDPRWPIPVAERSKAWACGCSLAGIADSNPAEDINVGVVSCKM
jgi:hypothetical protein